MSSVPVNIQSGGDSAPPYRVDASPGMAGWLRQHDVSLAITTYQIGKLFLVGAPDAGQLHVTERTFERCLGVAVQGESLYLAGLNAIYRFANVVPKGQELEGHDAVYVPQVAWYTGDVFAHDVGVLPDGRPLFVNTLFGCLATVDEATSFRPVWTPPFITQLAPQDRCHLNGLAMDDTTGRPAYMTAVAETDTPRGWADKRDGHGVVLDLATQSVVCRGLSMPHSPRLHRGALYVLNAGTGELGVVDRAARRFEAIASVPGFARGLAFMGGYALVGTSLPRANQVFAGLPLEERLKAAGRAPECAILVVELATGAVVHWLRLGGVVRELYDIALLPGHRSPMLVGFAQGQINRLISKGKPFPIHS
ncbi:TIGR03032 family protein [Roseococcus sp. SDR]|uniref:TIGR03032 family protein n=1 Tax=Roseococcus sp. SDR TaxID=2835532 RepID=UPI001BCDD4FD|nr:TIGR03032 family protein [Roseococcus sp. SDR]MBS7791699.1 TIGR03032 family protein [Roseococcus sp. SDR]MBV1847013.1 TIGR03032 family protein [Roseococcus sp. SDR]